MRTRTEENEIIRKALEIFERTTGLNVEFYPILEPNAQNAPDAMLDIKINGGELHFAAEVKGVFTHAMIGVAIQQLRKYKEKGIIITKYVTPQIADKLKEANVPFLDTAGNAYIKEHNFYVFIKGNRPEEIPNNKLQTRVFRPTGLQMIFALLCNPELEKANYREIARVADVALGTVGWVMQDLKRMGYIIDMGRRGRHLINKDKLLRKWVTAYPEQLRNKKLIDKFTAKNPDWWKNAELPNGQVYWGGEIAAAKMTKYLKPEMVTIYTDELNNINKWLLENRIRKEARGEIEILKTFWEPKKEVVDPGIVHPILVYADLQATGDPRNIETAEMIYEQELTQFIRED